MSSFVQGEEEAVINVRFNPYTIVVLVYCVDSVHCSEILLMMLWLSCM